MRLLERLGCRKRQAATADVVAMDVPIGRGFPVGGGGPRSSIGPGGDPGKSLPVPGQAKLVVGVAVHRVVAARCAEVERVGTIWISLVPDVRKQIEGALNERD